MSVISVTYGEVLQAIADLAKAATGVKLSFVGLPRQKPAHPSAAWARLISAARTGRNHSRRDDEERMHRYGGECTLNAELVVIVSEALGGPNEEAALADATQRLIDAFDADETLRAEDGDRCQRCALGTVTLFREAWDDNTSYAGLRVPVTVLL